MPNKCQVFVTLDNVHPKVLKTKKPLLSKGFKGGPTCTITNPLKHSISISYKVKLYPLGINRDTFWV